MKTRPLEGKSRERSIARQDPSGQLPPAPVSAAATQGHGVRLIEVPSEREGQRLDNWLLALLKGVPKSHVYRLLRTGQVRVDGGRAKAEHRLAVGEKIRVPPVRQAAEPPPAVAPSHVLHALAAQIVYEDRHFIALDKPSGLASHGGSGILLGAIEQLRQLRPAEDLALVHRLDRDTSGILLISRRRSALLKAQRALRDGHAHKRYLALLVGRMPRARMHVNQPLLKSALRGGERMVTVHPAGKASISEFKRLDQYKRTEFVEVRIETGRTHQIRVHAQYLGLPVAGDDKYGDEAANARLKKIGLDRLFLHAAELKLDFDDDTSLTLHAPLPAELTRVLDGLSGGRPQR